MFYMNRLKYILKHRYLFKILSVIVFIITIIFTNTYQRKSIYQETETNFTGIVYKKKISENKITIYIKAKEKLVINYYDN